MVPNHTSSPLFTCLNTGLALKRVVLIVVELHQSLSICPSLPMAELVHHPSDADIFSIPIHHHSSGKKAVDQASISQALIWGQDINQVEVFTV